LVYGVFFGHNTDWDGVCIWRLDRKEKKDTKTAKMLLAWRDDHQYPQLKDFWKQYSPLETRDDGEEYSSSGEDDVSKASTSVAT
jgi:hypothetical protein